MSDTKDQKNCETIQIAQLALQADLAAFLPDNIVHFDNDEQASATGINRIVVQASPRLPYAKGHDESVVLVFYCDVKITVYLAQNNTELLNTCLAAIQAANTGSTPASITTLKDSLFGSTRGFRYLFTEDGDREDTNNERQASQTWNALFDAP